MTIQARILDALKRTDGLCDDCLSEVTSVKPRQTINSECRYLGSRKIVSRAIGQCARCHRAKTVNLLRIGGLPQSESKPLARRDSSLNGKPWYWEGNVQTKIVQFLVSNAHVV